MIKIKKGCCISCGNCSSICPEVFEMPNGEKARVKAQKDSPCVDKAISSCPENCISK